MNTAQSLIKNEITLHGKSLFPGSALGKVWLLRQIDLDKLCNNPYIVELISSEIVQLDFAVSRSKDQISRFIGTTPLSLSDESSLIFKSSLDLLNDPAFISAIKETINFTGINSVSVLAEEIIRLRNTTLHDTNELVKKTNATLQDLYYRILYNMMPADEGRIASILKIPEGSILAAYRLTPVEVAVLPLNKVAGIIIEESTPHSHASIMLGTLGVPTIIDFPGIGSLLDASTNILIDAFRGYAFINPTAATIGECEDVHEHYTALQNIEESPIERSSIESLDGVTINLACNASTLIDIQHARMQGIREIGLFRSEIRYLSEIKTPSEADEKTFYKNLLGFKGITAATIRLIDLGGDKLPLYMQMTPETDPQLGCRGIRFLLARPDLMKQQLRSILSAPCTYALGLLLPFVTTIDDLMESKKIIEEVASELKMSTSPRVGIMVEVPSVATSIKNFLPKVDFVCLGTNDLIQCFFGANRDQYDLQKYNRFTHPAFLKLLYDIISSCNLLNTPVTVCGEMACDPLGSRLLAALGAHKLSTQPEGLRHVRKALSLCNIKELKAILPTLFELDSADAVEQKLNTLNLP